ncbi:ferredoxin-NADP reductase [Thermocatellispora tengchongensis]|uniref:Ferredoxin-NADP reductase n=1 Tax=Thermocatellispora tengchongensis TaxID=1073253 RepID=A0A840PHZ4_9ACTN|nr:hypothetical protein [Thermocatellispora tengchongensis]MBB5138762.1 ferredoxin-NADP reductase [Thermocatellispora tengchongensis]
MSDRSALITGLRDLAAFLETNPKIPIANSLTIHHFARHTDDTALRNEIDQIAAQLGSMINMEEIPHGHYSTSIRFGPVEYKAVAIMAAARARYAAENTYSGCIDPE